MVKFHLFAGSYLSDSVWIPWTVYRSLIYGLNVSSLITDIAKPYFLLLQSKHISYFFVWKKDTLTACGWDKQKIETATYCSEIKQFLHTAGEHEHPEFSASATSVTFPIQRLWFPYHITYYLSGIHLGSMPNKLKDFPTFQWTASTN